MGAEYVWDAKNGAVIDAGSGEVVDTIYVVDDEWVPDYDEFMKRKHSSPLTTLKFRVRDEVELQLRRLRKSSIRLYKLYRYESKSERYYEKKLLGVYTEVVNFLSRYRVFREDDRRLVAKLVREGWRRFRGYIHRYGYEVLAAGVAIAVAKLYGIPLIEKMVFEAFRIDREREIVVRRIYASFSSIYKMDRRRLLAEIVDRVVDELGASYSVASLAKFLLSRIRIDGRRSTSVVAGVVYLAALLCGEKEVTQRRLAEVLGISEATVKSTVRWICRALGVELVKTRAFAVVEVKIPRAMCSELIKMNIGISEIVKCVE